MVAWRVTREWPAATVFIVAGGPSVSALDLTPLRDRHVIAINSSWEAIPSAAFLFFADYRWWLQNGERTQAFAGRIVTTTKSCEDKRVLHLAKIKPPPSLATTPDALVLQRTSLQGAINLAYHLGAARLVLIGADMGRAADGRTHHHRPHPWSCRSDCWDRQMEQLRKVAPELERLGVEVLNASPASRIDWWPKVELVDCL